MQIVRGEQILKASHGSFFIDIHTSSKSMTSSHPDKFSIHLQRN